MILMFCFKIVVRAYYGAYVVAHVFNPIQAGVFCYYVGWEGAPFLHYLLSNYHQTWHDSSLR